MNLKNAQNLKKNPIKISKKIPRNTQNPQKSRKSQKTEIPIKKSQKIAQKNKKNLKKYLKRNIL